MNLLFTWKMKKKFGNTCVSLSTCLFRSRIPTKEIKISFWSVFLFTYSSIFLFLCFVFVRYTFEFISISTDIHSFTFYRYISNWKIFKIKTRFTRLVDILRKNIFSIQMDSRSPMYVVPLSEMNWIYLKRILVLLTIRNAMLNMFI